MIVTLTEGVFKAMFVSKLKSAALAIAALTVVTTGAGVLAQSPSPAPGDQAVQAEQLKKLEERLDRVVRALEATAPIKRATGDQATPKNDVNVDANIEEQVAAIFDHQKKLSNDV